MSTRHILHDFEGNCIEVASKHGRQVGGWSPIGVYNLIE